MIRGFVGRKDKTECLAWARAQAYIALGFALAQAAQERIACCPMEGFEPSAVAKILGLPSNETPVAFLAIGKSAEASKAVPHPKFNYAKDDLIKFIK